MADSVPLKREYSTVELLLGNDYYLDVILPQKIEVQPSLYLLGSKLGWLLTGRSNTIDTDRSDINMLILSQGCMGTEQNVFTCTDSVINPKPVLEDFWKIDSIGIMDDPNMPEDDGKALKHFKETVNFENGRYQVTWPWKEEDLELPVNREVALGRLKSSVKRMQKHPELMKSYDTVIQGQFKNDIIEKIDDDITSGLKHYIPHQAVINPLRPTTKLRIVYDTSAKSRRDENSLNDCLYRGPVMLKDLCGLFLRFRTYKVGIVADIENAFLQVGLQPNERDVTRFFWLKDITKPVCVDNIQEFRFCRVPFGMVSSPFLLAATIETHLGYKSELANVLKKNIYVDNVITGTETIGEAVMLYNGAKHMFKEASMNIREWISNSSQLNEIISETDKANTKNVKVLGHHWNVESDTISVKHSKVLDEKDLPLSKRNVLKQVASVFDPLGLCSPIVLKGKLLLQRMWSKHLDWDSTLDTEDEKAWLSIKKELSACSRICLPRCVTNLDISQSSTFRLLCFTDTSSNAYAASIYLHQSVVYTETVNLVFSKTRLTPLKTITIPRLELMAIVIGVRCLNFVRDQIGIQIQDRYLWTDSQCALEWLKTEKPLSVFVKNRIKDIKAYSDIKFGYVKSSENPADIASRGSTANGLQNNHLWWFGPTWLTKNDIEWKQLTNCLPDQSISSDFVSELVTNEEPLETNLETSEQTDQSETPFNIESGAYSSAGRLFRVTAYALRFVRKLQKRNSEQGTLKSHEIYEAELRWVKYIQKKCFSDVLVKTGYKKPTNLQMQLGLFVDSIGLIRCRGRLEHANLSEAARYPILLPKQEKLTQLLIERIHRQILHCGISQTLSQIRRTYWIPSGRAIVRKVLRGCLVCRQHKGAPFGVPQMPQIPKFRLTESTPFEHTGVDYLGPLNIKTSEGHSKVWICLFKCMVTRAIHLEVMNNMTTEEFLFGFRRFVSQRGTPIGIISDNAQHFKLANETLSRILKNVLEDDKTQSYVSNKGIKWKFIVELAPWMGGFYERLVGLVKRSLRKTIGHTLLTSVQLQTVIKEIEAVINSRPLVYVGDDINSNIALSPGHFLSLNQKTGIPVQDNNETDSDYVLQDSSANKLLSIWKKVQNSWINFGKSGVMNIC